MEMKKVVAGLLATAMIVSGVTVMPKTADAAAKATDVVIYESFDSEEAKILWGKEAPVFDGACNIDNCEGDYGDAVYYDEEDEEYVDIAEDIAGTEAYLFGGWYAIDNDLTYAKALDKLELEKNEYLAAKWVPANVLSVKGQNEAGVTASSEKASTRLISAIDSREYKKVGFTVEVNNVDAGIVAETNKVYDELTYTKGNESKTIKPSEAFGDAANFFIVWRLYNIPTQGFDTKIYVRPYWITKDGTRVDGLSRYSHVSDEYKGLVSVPINLNMAKQAAAGVVKINCPDGYTLDSHEAGRVFGEMAAAQSDKVVTCVGNVSDITKNADLNDLYINLRFKKSTEATGIATFSIDGAANDFCDNNEVEVDVNIWDVLY